MIELNHHNSLRYLSQLFSTANLRKLLKEGDSSAFKYSINQHLKSETKLSYEELIKHLYSLLEKEYRNEYVFKNTLLNKKLLGTYSLNTATVLDEFKVGSSIADFMLLNGDARIFEIKTDLDNFSKVQKQVSDYQKFAEKIYIVVGDENIEKSISLFEKTTVGIIKYTNRSTLREVKSAEKFTSLFCTETIFKTLRQKEYLSIVNDYFGIELDVPNTRVFKEALGLSKTIPKLEFQALAKEKLKQRKLRCPNQLLSKNTPRELKHLCYSLNLNNKDYNLLYKFLKSEI